MIAPWRGEREWVPVSNRLYARSLTCARTDGRCVSSGGGDVHTRCPLARPFGGSPPTLAGALPPECIFGSRRTFSLYGCFSALRLHVSQLRPGLFVLFLSSRLCCLRVVCINTETSLRNLCPHPLLPLRCVAAQASRVQRALRPLARMLKACTTCFIAFSTFSTALIRKPRLGSFSWNQAKKRASQYRCTSPRQDSSFRQERTSTHGVFTCISAGRHRRCTWSQM